MKFKLLSGMKPKGDQPQAIEKLTKRILKGQRYSTLLGVTGSGKTFTMAHVIQNINRPVLIMSHNKTLAAQLFAEFKEFFPENEVHYFVSYYDYYQPEAYIPQRDLYIEKDADINEDIEKLRLAATSAILTRRDVIIVASVSAIYNIGSPDDYREMVIELKKGERFDREKLLRELVDSHYERSDREFIRGRFRVRGDIVDIYPSYLDTALRVEFFDNTIERISTIKPLSGEEITQHEWFLIYPAKHFVLPETRIERAIRLILEELEDRVKWFKEKGKLLEAHRLEARTKYDVELLREVGYCKGIENYSRHLSGRRPGERPYTLIDYFPKDFLVFVDESHVTIPQIRGMYNGDRSRKEVLVEYGFRLPSALDNRPMKFEEWEESIGQVVFVSATPGPYEIKKSKGEIVEQIIRPTGLVDPYITVKPASDQVRDLLGEIRKRTKKGQRVLVTTLTKRLAEDLSNFLVEEGIKGCYLHSEIETIQRVQILREGKFDVLVGVNLLREGLDLPEVALVAILDADKEGFLRSETSIIQTIGRTARNVDGEVILYADNITKSMKNAIRETHRRRRLQLEYNKKYSITPKTIEKEIRKGIEEIIAAEKMVSAIANLSQEEYTLTEMIQELKRQMLEAADRLDFERAAELRDTIKMLSGEYVTTRKRKKRYKIDLWRKRGSLS
jgi:excinuclease ABC subunit B